MQKRRGAAGILLAAAAACGEGGEGGDSVEKIALLLPEKQTARYESADKPFFEAKFQELCPGVEVLYHNAGEDASAQQSQAEAAITAGAKVLVLDPVDGASAARIAIDAASRGIRVISYDRLLTGGAKPDFYVSFDNEAVGRLQGQALLDKLSADGKTQPRLVWIDGSPKDNNAALFSRGAHSVLDGKVTIVKEDAMTNWRPEEAAAIMDAAIAKLGADGFDAVYVANDGGAGGVIASMKSNGVDPKTRPISGQDAELAAVQRIVAGEQYMSVYKAVRPEAETAAKLACDLVSGRSPTEPTVPVNNGTADIPSILLTPIALTLDGAVGGTRSVQDTVVKDGFYGADTLARICAPEFEAACAAAGIR